MPCAQLFQSCLTLCHPMDCSPPGSSVHGILQARILEGVAMPSSRGLSQPRDRTCASCIAGRCFTTEPPETPQPENKPFFLLQCLSSAHFWQRVALCHLTIFKGPRRVFTEQAKRMILKFTLWTKLLALLDLWVVSKSPHLLYQKHSRGLLQCRFLDSKWN